MGVRLATDDFGTGYSSLSYLRQFRVNKLKIDRSFIKAVANNADDAAITGAIVRMAKSLGLRVIAEGVETEMQIAFLRAQECDEVQGYFFSKPLSVDAMMERLRLESRSHARAALGPRANKGFCATREWESNRVIHRMSTAVAAS